MKKFKDVALSTKIGIMVSVITAISLLMLWVIIGLSSSKMIRTNITNQLTDTVDSRAKIINDYILNVEEYMRAFAVSDEVADILRNPDDAECRANVQKYIKDFAEVKGTFEGLYVANTETMVVAHTLEKDIGVYYRQGDDRTAFLKEILVENKMTNRGIMVSPSTGELVISMYYPVFENGNCLGYVGGAVYANKLMDTLTEIDVNGLESIEYVFINAAKNVYLYHENEALLNTEVEDPAFLKIMETVAAPDAEANGTYSYKDENGVKKIAVYKYIEDRDWIFIVNDNESEAFSSIRNLQVGVGAVCFLIGTIINLAVVFALKPVGKQLEAIEKAIIGVSRLDLNAGDAVDKYTDRKDEIGKIASAVLILCEELKKVINDIGRVLGEISEGNLYVDVNENEQYYAGDLQVISGYLQSIDENLIDVMKDILTAANQVNSGSGQLASGAQMLSNGSIEQSESITMLADRINNIEQQIDSNFKHCTSTQELMERTSDCVEDANRKMQELNDAMANIKSSSDRIGNIVKTIEDIAFQTNILALNAAVEAARAGEVGKGFAVVADEVRNLAAKSAEAVNNTTALIEQTISAVEKGSGIAAEASESMAVVCEYTASAKNMMDSIASASEAQSEMVTQINADISNISAVIQTNSATAEESAATSEELAAQANVLNELISHFKIEE